MPDLRRWTIINHVCAQRVKANVILLLLRPVAGETMFLKNRKDLRLVVRRREHPGSSQGNSPRD